MNTILRRFFSSTWTLALLTIASTTLFAYVYVASGTYLLELASLIIAGAFFVITYYKFEWGLYALIFALPFNGTHIVGQLRLTELITLVLILVYVIQWILGRRPTRIPLGTLFIVLSFFLFVNALSMWNALLPLTSVKRVFILGYLILTAYLIGQVVETEKILRGVVRAFLMCATIFGAYGVYQFFSPAYRIVAFSNVWNVSGLPRITLFYGDPNLLSGYLLINILLCLALFYNGVERKSWWLRLALPLSIIDMLLTFSRSGVIAAAVGGVVLLAMNSNPTVLKQTGKVLGALILALVIVYSASSQVRNAIAPAISRLTRLTDTSVDSVGARVVAYQEALNMAADHPIIGIGPDMFPYEYDVRTGITAPEPHVVPHNLILEILAEKGILGLLAFFGIMGTLFYKLIVALKATPKTASFHRAVLQWITVSLIAFLIHTLFLTGLYEVYLWVLIGLAYALTSRAWSHVE